MKRRMNNIFRKDGRSFVLAMDHSAMMPSPDIKEPGRVISEAVEGGADGFLTTYGIIRKYQKDFGNRGIILRADGGISAIRKPMAPMDLLYSAEDAVRIGADAMLCMGYPGSQTNEHTLKYLAELVQRCFPTASRSLKASIQEALSLCPLLPVRVQTSVRTL